MSFQEIAAAALERSFSIIPLVPRGKEPLPGWGPTRKCRNWSDFGAVKGVTEDCNVGIVADENFLILETDDEGQLRQLVRNCTGRELPITLTSQARPGRPHFYYRQTPRTLEVGNCTVAGLFELRAKNQYVVGPGSVHPSGAVYQITADYEVLPMPGWLVDCLLYLKGAASTVPAGQRVEVPLSGKVGEGEGRHYLLTSWAGRLWDGKKTEEALFEEVWAINEQSCDPPRTEAHVRDIVRWVMSNGTPHDPGPKLTFGSTEIWGKTAHELINRELPAREVLLSQGETPVLFEASLNQIFATRGLGKTNLALGLAGCLASGSNSFLRYHAPKATNVLYVDGEMPLVQLQERIRVFVGDVPSFRYVNAEDLPGCRIPSLSVKDGKGQAAIVAAVEAHESQVLVLDSLATLFRFETNDERSWIELEDFFKLLRQKYRLCVITLHHAGKAGLQRGHSRGDDLLDVSIKLDKFPEWEPGDGLQFQLKYEKVRHGGYLESFDAALIEGKWEVNPPTASTDEVKELLDKGKGRIAIAKATGVPEWKVRKIQAQMKAEGLTKLNKEKK
jgi:hypothetical protein